MKKNDVADVSTASNLDAFSARLNITLPKWLFNVLRVNPSLFDQLSEIKELASNTQFSGHFCWNGKGRIFSEDTSRWNELYNWVELNNSNHSVSLSFAIRHRQDLRSGACRVRSNRRIRIETTKVGMSIICSFAPLNSKQASSIKMTRGRNVGAWWLTSKRRTLPSEASSQAPIFRPRAVLTEESASQAITPKIAPPWVGCWRITSLFAKRVKAIEWCSSF